MGENTTGLKHQAYVLISDVLTPYSNITGLYYRSIFLYHASRSKHQALVI